MSHHYTVLLTASYLLLSIVAPFSVWAQDELDSATARSLFEQGVELASNGRWADAADRFQRSLSLRESPVVAYNLAVARMETGRLVEASELLTRVEKDPAGNRKLKRQAAALQREIEPKIATLVVSLDERAAMHEARINERPIPPAALGVPTPVDPGEIVVTLEEDGQQLWSQRLVVSPGSQQRVTIRLPPRQSASGAETSPPPRESALAPSQVALPASEPNPGPRVAQTRPARDPPARDDGSLWEEPWLWAGAGAVIVGAVVVGLLASGGDSDREPAFEGSLEPGHLEVPP